MILHSHRGDYQTTKILTVSHYCGVDLKLNILERKDVKSLKGLIFGRLPALEIEEGKFIEQPHAIVRYLAKDVKYENPMEATRNDILLEMILANVDPEVIVLTRMIHGIIQHDKNIVKAATKNLFDTLKLIEKIFFKESEEFLIGGELKIGDIALFTTLLPVFSGAVSFKKLNSTPKLKSWIENQATNSIVTKYTGRARFADVPFRAPQ